MRRWKNLAAAVRQPPRRNPSAARPLRRRLISGRRRRAISRSRSTLKRSPANTPSAPDIIRRSRSIRSRLACCRRLVLVCRKRFAANCARIRIGRNSSVKRDHQGISKMCALNHRPRNTKIECRKDNWRHIHATLRWRNKTSAPQARCRGYRGMGQRAFRYRGRFASGARFS